MSTTVSRTRKVIIALVAAASIGAIAAPASAEAKGWKHGHGHGHYGYGAAAIGGGLLLGAIIASNSRAYAADCWVEKRKFYDAYGYPYFRKIRVCD